MLLSFLAISALCVLITMISAFIVSHLNKDTSIVDIFWGVGFIIIALVTLFCSASYHPRKLLGTCLVIFWGLRLSTQILIRKIGKPEDPRYAKWKEQWGKNYIFYSFFYIFLAQAVAMFIIAYPIVLINATDAQPGLNSLDLLGLLLWGIGFLFESIADWQLYSFLKNPLNKGKILTSGLWRYSRHPNYFGEASMWWGIFLIALNCPYGITAIISPLLISYLLLFVSGIPPAEKILENNSDFIAYKKRTSVFFPWPPKQI